MVIDIRDIAQLGGLRRRTVCCSWASKIALAKKCCWNAAVAARAKTQPNMSSSFPRLALQNEWSFSFPRNTRENSPILSQFYCLCEYSQCMVCPKLWSPVNSSYWYILSTPRFHVVVAFRFSNHPISVLVVRDSVVSISPLRLLDIFFSPCSVVPCHMYYTCPYVCISFL